MKSFIALTIVACAFVCIAAVPVPEIEATEPIAKTLESPDEIAIKNEVEAADAAGAAAVGGGEEHESVRQKRATCDLLSFTGANHSLCAAHCIARGNRGGHCNGSAVCVCRN